MRVSGRVIVVSMVYGLVGTAFGTPAFADGEQVPLSNVPRVVIRAALGAVKDLKLTKAEMEEVQDRKTYELTGNAEGKRYTVEVEQDGKVIKTEEEGDVDNEKATLSTVPKAASDAAVAAVKGLKLMEAEVEQEQGQTVYDLRGATPSTFFHRAKQYSVKVTAEGKVIHVEEVEGDDEKD